MRIRRARIRNFRALSNVTIEFDSVTTFIGPNGVGKSTVLRALEWFFNGTTTGALTAQDCSFGNSLQSIEVEVTFTDLTEADVKFASALAPFSGDELRALKRRENNGKEYLLLGSLRFAGFAPIRAATTFAEKKGEYAALRLDAPEFELPSAKSGAAIEEALLDWERRNPTALTFSNEQIPLDTFSSSGEHAQDPPFRFVMISADLRAADEAQDSRSSLMGRLLEGAIDRSAADAQIARIVEDSKAAQLRVYQETFAPQLRDLATQLNRLVAGYSPGRIVDLAPSGLDSKASRTTFEVSILDGEMQTPVDHQGHGFQRTLLIAALQLLADAGSTTSQRATFLAIEEPELFQHPLQAQAFARVLRALAESSEQNVQVAYATHSHYFIAPGRFHEIRRLSRRSEAPHEVMIHSATQAQVVARLAGHFNFETIARQLDLVVANSLAVALFAQRAVVVEGTTDMAVLFGLADRIAPGYLEVQGIAVVPADGKTNVPLVHAILDLLGIPTYAVFDGDRKPDSPDHPTRGSEANPGQSKKENRRLLRYFGATEVDFPGDSVEDLFATFDDSLEPFLTTRWPEWVTARQEYIETLGFDPGKNSNAYRQITATAGGVVPDMLSLILRKVSSPSSSA